MIDELYYATIYYGRLHNLLHLHDRGCPWKEEILIVLSLLMRTDAPRIARSWNEDTCNTVVVGDHLDYLKYLHKNECPWDIGCAHVQR